MNPVENSNGRSFKGAVLYYTHDKKALTDERVLFTHTENLPTKDPELAAKVMAYTHAHQRDIRVAAGTLGEGQRNRKTPKPVYSYCLTWHPEQDPTQEHMIEAARSSLKKLGLNEHEIIMAAHSDEPHPHIHIVANVIHPETGIKNDLKFTKRRLSEWALNYQRERGENYSPQREENHRKRQENQKRREAGEEVHERVKDTKSLSAAEYHRWSRKKSIQAIQQREKDIEKVSRRHQTQRNALTESREQEIKQHRIRLKERHRPFWASMYQEQHQQKQELESAQSTTWGRLSYFLKHHNRFDGSPTRLSVKGLITNSFKAITSSKKAFSELEQKHAERRKYLSGRVNNTIRSDLKKINDDHDRKLDELVKQQAKESAILKKAQSLQSEKNARDIVTGKRREEFDRETKYKHLRETADPDQKTSRKQFDRSSMRQKHVISEIKKKPVIEKKKIALSPVLEKRKATRADFKQTKKDITGDQPLSKEDKRKQLLDAFTDTKKEMTEQRELEPEKDNVEDKSRTDTTGRSNTYTAFQDSSKNKGKGRSRERERGDDLPPVPKPPAPPKT